MEIPVAGFYDKNQQVLRPCELVPQTVAPSGVDNGHPVWMLCVCVSHGKAGLRVTNAEFLELQNTSEWPFWAVPE